MAKLKFCRSIFTALLFNYTLLAFVFAPFEIESQENLILNPSCEESVNVPNTLAQYDLCKYWWNPYIWTTDYFTSLTATSNQNYIPQNVFGNQVNISGNNYLGVVLCVWNYSLNDFSNFRTEYAAGQFSLTLEKDKIYQFEFWMSKAEKGILQSNAIDLVLTYDTIVDVNNYGPYGYKIWSEEVPMSDTIDWVKISTCFKARGNETAFAIGNFHEINEVIKVVANDPNASGEMDYRYLDNFSLIECPTCCPEQFPYEDHLTIQNNPSWDNSPVSMTIWINPNSTAELTIYDSAGRLVAKEEFTELLTTYTLPPDLAPGVYHYAFSSSNGVNDVGKVLVSE